LRWHSTFLLVIIPTDFILSSLSGGSLLGGFMKVTYFEATPDTSEKGFEINDKAGLWDGWKTINRLFNKDRTILKTMEDKQ